MKLVDDFYDYELLDMNNGMKLERWGDVILSRPDPQIIWNKEIDEKLWNKAHAIYNRSDQGGGAWEIKNSLVNRPWQVKYKDLTFNIKLMGFKHTGLFPEQAYNWNLIRDLIKKSNREVKVLNLFAYTGGATVAALSAGASVVHVDSSKGMVDWAKENVFSSGLAEKSIRFIVDDVKKFVAREIRRGNKYDIIIMDPPTYGKGAKGEVWNIEDDLFKLVNDCSEILSKEPILFLISSYTSGLPKSILENVLKSTINIKYSGIISSDELGISSKINELVLPCGIYARWERKDN